jgi:hypothetical protein
MTPVEPWSEGKGGRKARDRPEKGQRKARDQRKARERKGR